MQSHTEGAMTLGVHANSALQLSCDTHYACKPVVQDVVIPITHAGPGATRCDTYHACKPHNATCSGIHPECMSSIL